MTYLGFCISDPLLQKIHDDGITNSMQTTKFARKFLDTLSMHYEVTNISSPSVIEFPKSAVFFTPGELPSKRKKNNFVFPLINIFIIKNVLQFICPLLIILFRIRSPVYICHGFNLSYMLTLYFVKLVINARIVLLATDPPLAVSLRDSRLKRCARWIYVLVVRHMVNRFDGMIALSPEFASLLNFRGKFLYIEGIN